MLHLFENFWRQLEKVPPAAHHPTASKIADRIPAAIRDDVSKKECDIRWPESNGPDVPQKPCRHHDGRAFDERADKNKRVFRLFEEGSYCGKPFHPVRSSTRTQFRLLFG